MIGVIVGGIVLFALLLGGVIFFFWKRKKRKERLPSFTPVDLYTPKDVGDRYTRMESTFETATTPTFPSTAYTSGVSNIIAMYGPNSPASNITDMPPMSAPVPISPINEEELEFHPQQNESQAQLVPKQTFYVVNPEDDK